MIGSKLVAQTYDGASMMAGEISNLNAREIVKCKKFYSSTVIYTSSI